MSQNQVKVTVRLYEVDGEKIGGLKAPELVVRSHWNHHGSIVTALVVLETPKGEKFSVAAADLEHAINATTGLPL